MYKYWNSGCPWNVGWICAFVVWLYCFIQGTKHIMEWSRFWPLSHVGSPGMNSLQRRSGCVICPSSIISTKQQLNIYISLYSLMETQPSYHEPVHYHPTWQWLLFSLVPFRRRHLQFLSSWLTLVLVLYQFASLICQLASMKAKESVLSAAWMCSPGTFRINKLKWWFLACWKRYCDTSVVG